MEIRNAIIITDADTQLRMSVDEQTNFTGNIVFSRDKLSRDVVAKLDHAVGRSSKDDATATDSGRVSVKPELVG